MAADDTLLTWLRSLGLEQYWQTLVDNDIDLSLISELKDSELERLGLSLGDRKRFLRGVTERGNTALNKALQIKRQQSLDQAQRRQLTVMFCDLVGSTLLSASMDPEDLRRITHAYQDLSGDIVSNYEGLVSRLIGDGMLIYFGFPQAHENDPERAILAAREIVQRLCELETGDKSEALQVRIGIATGQVVVADQDSDDVFRRGDVFGEAPNLAARLQGLAEPNGIVVANRTRQLAADRFQFLDIGDHRLKGFNKPVRAWQVVAKLRSSTRFNSGSRRRTPLIGRDRQQRQLWHSWQRACDGVGQLVIVRGEAGIGKSRLVRSLVDHIGSERHFQLINQCSPYKTNNALFPVIFELERIAGIQPWDNAQLKIAKLRELHALRSDDHNNAIEAIAALLGIDLPGSGISALRPDATKDRILKVLAERVDWLATQAPVLYLVEDAQWIDPSTLALLRQLSSQIADQRVMLLITARPEFTPDWKPLAQLTTLSLERLSAQHSSDMVHQLCGKRRLPSEVSARILKRTDGNPLFIEEVTRLVLDSDLLELVGSRYLLQGNLSQLAIPDTLNDSLMARIDRMSSACEVARIGATLGREFSLELISAVSGMDRRALLGDLQRLVEAGLLLREGGTDGQAIDPGANCYRFKHALIQEATYQSLLKTRRQQLHARALQALDQQDQQCRRQPSPELLALHCSGAQLYQRAVGYWQQAADSALAQSAYGEAAGHLHAGLDLIDHIAAGAPRDRLEFRLRLGLGIALTASHGYGLLEVRDHYARATELAQRLGATKELFTALYGSWYGTLMRTDYSHSREIGQQLLALASNSGVAAFRVSAHRALGTALFYTGELRQALQTQQRGLSIPASDDNRAQAMRFDVADPWVTLQCYRAATLWLLGRSQESATARQQALQAAQRIDHPFTLVLTMGRGCWLGQLCGDRALTREYAEQTCNLARQHDFPFWLGWGTLIGAWANTKLDQQTRIDTMHRGLQEWKGASTNSGLVYYHYLLADVQAHYGDHQAALANLTESQQGAERLQERWWSAEMYRLRGELLISKPTPQPNAAERAYRHAIGIARSQHALPLWLRAATSLASLLADQPDGRQAARNLLTEALAQPTDSLPELELARRLMATL